ncbi:unnamed protein product, partial [marine sediment metagenome]
MKKIVIALTLALAAILVFGGTALAWDYEDPCVAANEDFWNVNGWDDGVQQPGPPLLDGSESLGHVGGQHPYWVDPDTGTVLVADGYNLYRDDVTDTGNLDMVRFRTDTPDEIG